MEILLGSSLDSLTFCYMVLGIQGSVPAFFCCPWELGEITETPERYYSILVRMAVRT